MKSLAITGAVLASSVIFAGPAAASTPPTAVFVQSNAPDGNTIVVYDSALRPAGSYPTGGKGGALSGAVVDRLASQGSLTLDRAHNLLYAVNAGSNTITVFGVHGTRLTRRQVIGSGGTFPVSVATHGDLVYVLNARDGGTVQGFRRLGSQLIRVPSWNRRLGLDPAATPEFTHTPGQVAFRPDGSQLLVTTKANTNAVDVFAVDHTGGLSKSPAVNVEDGAVPFAIAFDRRGHLALAEAGPSAVATFDLHLTGKITARYAVPTGQAATCWITYADGTFYASNAGSGTVSAYRAGRDGQLTALGTTTTDAGTVDAAASSDGRHLYVQAGAKGIVDAYRINADGSLTPTGSAAVPGSAGGEGITAG